MDMELSSEGSPLLPDQEPHIGEAAELVELKETPGLERLLNTLVQHCERVQSLGSTLDAMRRGADVEQKEKFLNGTLVRYKAAMQEFRDLQEEIEDSARLLAEKREGQRGLLVIAQKFLEPIESLFIDQDEKDIAFRKLVEPIEFVGDDTSTNEFERPEPPNTAELSSIWSPLERTILPFQKSYEEILRRRERGDAAEADLAAAWTEKQLAFERFQVRLAKKRDLAPAAIADLEARGRSLLRPDEPIPTMAPSIEAVRATHQKVRATYAAVAHTLSLEQRIHMRTKIAQLSSLVREAELEHDAIHR